MTKETTTTPTLDQRVDFITAELCRGAWQPEHVATYAERWGLSKATVERDAAEATRRTRALVEATGVRLRIASALDRALDVAEAQGDPKAVANVAQAYMRIVGADAPARVEIVPALPPWLPPELAPLLPYLPTDLDGPPTVDEWKHLASQLVPEECTLEDCRMHPR